MSLDQKLAFAYLGLWLIWITIAFTGWYKALVWIKYVEGLKPRGSTKAGFLVKIRKNMSEQEKKETLAHELHHVMQTYLCPPFLYAIIYLIPFFQRHLEASAYAESVKNGRSLNASAGALAHNHFPGKENDREKAAKLITKYL